MSKTPKIQIAFTDKQAQYLRERESNISELIKTLLDKHYADFPPSAKRGRKRNDPTR